MRILNQHRRPVMKEIAAIFATVLAYYFATIHYLATCFIA
jgi:hypothetical protein